MENIYIELVFLFFTHRFQVNTLTGQLSITSVREKDYGNYTCRASNQAGEAEARVLINVLMRPKIYELLNVTRPENKEAELICKANGRPPPAITFRYAFLRKSYL